MIVIKNQLIVCLALLTGVSAVPTSASASLQIHKKHHVSPLVAGVAAYEIAKHTGKHGHKNILQRHPVLTGLGAAYLAHKHNKKIDKHH